MMRSTGETEKYVGRTIIICIAIAAIAADKYGVEIKEWVDYFAFVFGISSSDG